MVTLGKSLSGGFIPISCVLANNEIMDLIKPGDHGSTFGGYPLAAAVGMEALNVILDEGLVENSLKMGEKLMKDLEKVVAPFKRNEDNPEGFVKEVRGRGLMMAIEIYQKGKLNAWAVTHRLKELGLLAKPTHEHIIRLAPPLCITEKELDDCVVII
jgi:ornithine--oxo-acid transaminase